MPLAFTRQVSPRIVDCALTHLDRAPIDADLATSQHAAYERALREAGYDIVRLPYLPDDPDAVFVEDTAILLGRHAIITRPGAPSRADEVDSIAEGLEPYFTIHRLAAGILDGGDVLKIGSRLYVGQSSRTDSAGTRALREAVEPLGYRIVPVGLGRCLHLKTAVTLAGANRDVEVIAVDRDEPFAANAVRAGERLIYAAGSPRTAQRLRDGGFTVVEVDLSELQKAEAGGTCMSLISG